MGYNGKAAADQRGPWVGILDRCASVKVLVRRTDRAAVVTKIRTAVRWRPFVSDEQIVECPS